MSTPKKHCGHPNHGADDHQCGSDPCGCRLLSVGRSVSGLVATYDYDASDCEVHQ